MNQAAWQDPFSARGAFAYRAGSTLVVFDQLAPVDEFGNPYPEPLLKQLLGNKNVIHVKDTLAAVGKSSAGEKFLRLKSAGLFNRRAGPGLGRRGFGCALALGFCGGA